ncbi:MAG: type IV pilus modification protein PilV [Pseudomonadota bacterium]
MSIMKSAYPKGKGTQRGFSLLEVLIAMLILGVAVMGFAGLQVRALQSTGVAHVRSQAMTLAAEMAERMRVNETALATYRTTANWTAALPSDDPPNTWGSNSCIYTSTSGNGCNATQMALFDIREMRYYAQQVLPGGTMNVSSCDGSLVCVFVAWRSANPLSGDATACVDNQSADCVSMRVWVQ